MPKPSSSPRLNIVYCIVPEDLADRLHEPLRAHFAGTAVEVVVEQRWRDRRHRPERRVADETRPLTSEERRLIRALQGRRVAEQRAAAVPVDAPQLPRKARAHAARLAFVERLAPSTQQLEDRDTARLVARFQAGDREVFGELYLRYFDRVYSYIRVIMHDTHEAEDATQQVFMQVLEALPTYERRRSQPWRGWLFVVARNYAVWQMRNRHRVDITDPADMPPQPGEIEQPEGFESLPDWVTDADLLVLIERLPLVQRQVLMLRYMLNMTVSEVSEILDLTPNHVSVLQYRAQSFLRERLVALGRPRTGPQRPARARSRFQQAPVLRARRFMLLP